MSDVQVISTTQVIEVDEPTSSISISTTQVIEVDEPTSSISITNAGPPGPPGSPGSFDLVPVLAEVDSRIATHNQATPVHPGATSGRDFVALFQNGLV